MGVSAHETSNKLRLEIFMTLWGRGKIGRRYLMRSATIQESPASSVIRPDASSRKATPPVPSTRLKKSGETSTKGRGSPVIEIVPSEFAFTSTRVYSRRAGPHEWQN